MNLNKNSLKIPNEIVYAVNLSVTYYLTSFSVFPDICKNCWKLKNGILCQKLGTFKIQKESILSFFDWSMISSEN